MAFTVLAGFGTTTAFAASETAESYMISFPRDGDAAQIYSEDAWGHSAKTYMNGWTTGSSNYTTLHCMDSFDGKVCYCIEPGLSRNVGDTYHGFGEDFWDNYPSQYNNTIEPDDIKLLLGRIMHEILHVVLQHCLRQGDRDSEQFNISGTAESWEQAQLPRRNPQGRCRGICSECTIGITKKSRTIPAHTYKEAQKGKKKSSVLIQLSGWLRTLDMVREAGLEPARPEWTLEPESSESANSTTRAYSVDQIAQIL